MTSRSVYASPETEDLTKERRETPYHVIMLNDDDHTYEYVIEMLQTIFKFSYAQAIAHTMEADTTGSSILITCSLEEAEQKRDQIHAYGPDWRLPHSRGSVSAVVEPAEG